MKLTKEQRNKLKQLTCEVIQLPDVIYGGITEWDAVECGHAGVDYDIILTIYFYHLSTVNKVYQLCGVLPKWFFSEYYLADEERKYVADFVLDENFFLDF